MADDLKLQVEITALNSTSSAFESMTKAIEGVQKLVGDVTKAFDSFSKAVDSDMSSASRSVDDLTKPLTTDQKAFEETIATIEKVGTTAESASKQASEALATITTPLKDDAKNADAVTNSLKDMAKEAEDAGTTAQKALSVKSSVPGSTGHSGGEGGLFGMQGQMDTMYAGIAMGGAALSLDVGIKAAIGTFTQFDQAVANVNSMMGETPKQVEALKQQLVDLSKTVPEGPVALANALYGIVGAGVPANQAMDVLRISSKAAAAGQTDLSTASGAIISVMDSYGLSAKSAGQIADQMFAANQAGALTFNQLASSVGTVAGPAATAGVNFGQVAAATAALTNQGISAQRATEGLRALLMGIVAPTKGAQKEAKALGIEWDDNALKQKGLSGMMQEAMKATHGNGEELKKLIPNIAAWTVAVDLGGKGAQSYQTALQAMANATGSTSKALQAQEQGTSEQLDEMHNAIQRAQISFVQGFAPAITAVAEDVSKLASWFANLSPQTRKIIGDIALGSAAFLTLGASLFMAISGFGSLLSGLKSVSIAMGIFEAVTDKAGEKTLVFTGLQKAQALATKVAAAAQVAFNAIMDANPIAIVILAVTALIGIIVLLATHWKQVTDWMEQHWGINVPKIMNNLRQVFTTVWNAIKLSLQIVWDYFKTVFEVELIVIQTLWRTVWEAIKLVLKVTFDEIVGILKVAWDIIQGTFKVVLDVLSGNWSKAWSDMKDALGTIWNDIKSMFSNMIQDGFDFGKNLIQMIAHGIESTVGTVVSAVSHVASSIKSFLGFHSPTEKGPGSEADTWAPAFMQMYIEGIQAGIPKLQATLANAIQSPFGVGNLAISQAITQPAPAFAGSSFSAGTSPVYNQIIVQGSVIHERELVDLVQRGQWQKMKSMSKF